MDRKSTGTSRVAHQSTNSWIHTGCQSSASGSVASAVATSADLSCVSPAYRASGTKTLVDGPPTLSPASMSLIARAVASYSSKYCVRVPVQKCGTRFGSFHTSKRHWRTSSMPYRSIQCRTVVVTSSTQRAMSLRRAAVRASTRTRVSVCVASALGMNPSSTKGRAPVARTASNTLST